MCGGAEGNRTPDLCSAIAALSIVKEREINGHQLQSIEANGASEIQGHTGAIAIYSYKLHSFLLDLLLDCS